MIAPRQKERLLRHHQPGWDSRSPEVRAKTLRKVVVVSPEDLLNLLLVSKEDSQALEADLAADGLGIVHARRVLSKTLTLLDEMYALYTTRLRTVRFGPPLRINDLEWGFSGKVHALLDLDSPLEMKRENGQMFAVLAARHHFFPTDLEGGEARYMVSTAWWNIIASSKSWRSFLSSSSKSKSCSTSYCS